MTAQFWKKLESILISIYSGEFTGDTKEVLGAYQIGEITSAYNGLKDRNVI